MRETLSLGGRSLDHTFLIVILGWVVLAAYFGMKDLEISNQVADPGSTIGEFGYYFGQGPGYGIISIAIIIMVGGLSPHSERQRMAGKVGIIASGSVVIIGMPFNDPFFIINPAFIIASIALFMHWSKGKDWDEYRKLATIVILLAIINPILSVQVTKILWGRVRFNDLSPDQSNFTPWYNPRGPGVEDLSFMSGHSAMAWMLLPLLITMEDRGKRNPSHIILTMSIVFWGCFVSYSRVVAGAHYPSDVLFPGGIAYLTTYLAYSRGHVQDRSDDSE